MPPSLGVAVLCLTAGASSAQSLAEVAEQIRLEHHIPELAWAVVSSDAVLEQGALGTRKADEALPARLEQDRFRLGSNTKAVTSLIAARLVRAGKLEWSTRFFALFPEWKARSQPAHWGVTLSELLGFRSRVPMYTYTDPQPTPESLAASKSSFVQWALERKPAAATTHSNAGYAAAGLMLERASGQPYAALVRELNEALHVELGVGEPNALDPTQVWGHTGAQQPAPRVPNPRLEWLMAAGNLNATLPDAERLLQAQLLGLRGRSPLLPQQTFELMHHGFPGFGLGWFWERNAAGHRVSHNLGNPGAFTSAVVVIDELDRAYVVLTNAQSEETSEGINALLEALQLRYGS